MSTNTADRASVDLRGADPHSIIANLSQRAHARRSRQILAGEPESVHRPQFRRMSWVCEDISRRGVVPVEDVAALTEDQHADLLAAIAGERV